VLPVHETRHDDTVEVRQHRGERLAAGRRFAGQQRSHVAWFHRGRHGVAFDSLEVAGDPVDEGVPVLTELVGGHGGHHARVPFAAEQRLPYRDPYAFGALMDFLVLRAVPGVEEITDAGYRRTLRLPHGAGVMELAADPPSAVRARFRLDDHRDLDAAVRLARHLLDLDADSTAIDAALGADPLIGALVQAQPGRRVPHTVDSVELLVRAVLGQQVSVKGARTLAARLVRRVGTPLSEPDGGLTHLFPAPAALADGDLDGLGLTGARVRTIHHLGEVMASGELLLEPGGQSATAAKQLVALPGIGPWTASYVAMRVLGDADAFLATDLGVRHALTRLGHPSDPTAATAVAERWRPWRAYALMHLWGLEMGHGCHSHSSSRHRVRT